MSNHVIEQDLESVMLVQGHMDQIRAEAIRLGSEGARTIDIVIRNAGCYGGEFPEIIVDYGGELLQTLAEAIRILNAPESQKIQRALRIAILWDKVGSHAQREWLSTIIEICAEKGEPIFPAITVARPHAELEHQVIKTATAWRNCTESDGARLLAQLTLDVDALIAAREKAKGVE